MEMNNDGNADEMEMDGFWRWFRRHEKYLRGSCVDDPAWAELGWRLRRISPDLYYELYVESEPCELVITAQGRVEAFSLIDELVSKSPELSGWCIHALKPAGGFDLMIRIEGEEFSTKSVVCRPLEPRNGKLGLIVGFPGCAVYDAGLIRSAVLLMLDAGLGERRHCTMIGHVRIVEAAGMDSCESIPLRELPRFLDWCRENDKRGES